MLAFLAVAFSHIQGVLTQATKPACIAATETTLSVTWEAVSATDLYYVSLASTPLARPFALQTTAEPNITLIDLLPGQNYYIQLRSHPSADDIVWGWRSPSVAVKCVTVAASTDRPHTLRRLGDAPSEHSIALTWEPAHISPATRHEVGVRADGRDWRWESAQAENKHAFESLPAGTWFEVAVRERGGRQSEAMRLRTAAVGALHTLVYRVSEYSFEVDFLENHDGASAGATHVQMLGHFLPHVHCPCPLPLFPSSPP